MMMICRLAPGVFDRPSTRLVHTPAAKVSKTPGSSRHISINLSTFYLTLAFVVKMGRPYSAGGPLSVFSVLVLPKYLIKAILGEIG